MLEVDPSLATLGVYHNAVWRVDDAAARVDIPRYVSVTKVCGTERIFLPAVLLLGLAWAGCEMKYSVIVRDLLPEKVRIVSTHSEWE